MLYRLYTFNPWNAALINEYTMSKCTRNKCVKAIKNCVSEYKPSTIDFAEANDNRCYTSQRGFL